ncbi:MAG: tyrosine--tRNA ligase [Candidatus Orphnella occulta]|nr:tyrosine--tRNA ligase [Candidatus Orphnella occulta]MDP8296610.1 tyrosine--tRNA ligase [Candidatus Orphnella occulta]
MDIKKSLELIKRGTVEIINEKQLLLKLEQSKKEKKPLIIKAGFDPTAPDIHLGHTVLLKKMRHFQDLGHTVIFLIGDYTGLIGDPSGASKTRPRLTEKEVADNAKTYESQVSKVLDMKKLKVCFNSEWLQRMDGAKIAELMSKYSVSQMLERDDFSKRYKAHKPINMLEFLYPLLQGYDSFALKADIELGGNDQKFNLLVGRDIQAAYGQVSQVVITMPLLEGTDGIQKMSKSYGNYIGITDTPKEMFGKVMSISDELMWKYYELLTDVFISDIKKMQKDAAAGSFNPKDAKVRLAKEIITIYHSSEDAKKAQEEFDNVFKKGNLPEDMPTYETERSEQFVWDIIKKAKLADTSSQARRLMEQGGVSVDGEKIQDINTKIKPKENMIIQVGKRRFLRVKIKQK